MKKLLRLIPAVALVGWFAFGHNTPSQAAAAAECTVDGSVTLGHAVTNPPTPPTTVPPSVPPTVPPLNTNTFSFTSVAINCVGTAPIAGSWSVSASGSSANETCAAATGSGSFTGGSGPAGSVTGGSFTFTRAGTHVHVDGSISTASATAKVIAELEFVPDQLCPGTTSARIVGEATATIQ